MADPLRRRRRYPGLLRSAGLRLVLLFLLLFGAGAVAFAVTVWWETAGLLHRQTDTAIDADVQGLAERWNEGGTPALIDIIQARISGDVDEDAMYLLADRNYDTVVGNLGRWPAGMSGQQNWFELPILHDGRRKMARVHRFDLPDGFHLLVGRNAQLGAQLRRLLTGALLWAMLVVLVLGIVGAWLVRRMFARSLSGVFATAAAISAGDLDQRVPRTHKGDEFDSLAETINDMLDRIARLMDGVRHVSDAIAHDLRTPITRARMRLEDAARHAHGADDLLAAIERAQSDLDGVVAVFQALLRITEIESGARRSAFTSFDLAARLRDLVEFYEAAAEERGVSLTLSCPKQVELMGDPALIQQAIANLIDNALKFSPEGGALSVTVTTGAELRVVVADRGPGMAQADRDRATERFFRAETARTTPGSGLGLSLVDAVVRLHGGALLLGDNDPGLVAEMRLPVTATPSGQ